MLRTGTIRVSVAGAVGESTAVFAPGSEIFTTLPHQRYGYISGSSIAAAHVSGVIAPLLEVVPGLDAAEVAALLAGDSPTTGLSACAALAQVEQDVDCGADRVGAAEAPSMLSVVHN